MNIPASVIADLHLLDEVLDGPSNTYAALTALIAGAAHAVPSYLGLSVGISMASVSLVEFSTFENASDLEKVGSSLRFSVQGDASFDADEPALMEVILHAAKPGAFVDLAADLTWLTGRSWRDFRIDEDLLVPGGSAGRKSVKSWSTINQALGLLISTGLTLDEADAELDARAARTGRRRDLAAVDVLEAGSSGESPLPS